MSRLLTLFSGSEAAAEPVAPVVPTIFYGYTLLDGAGPLYLFDFQLDTGIPSPLVFDLYIGVTTDPEDLTSVYSGLDPNSGMNEIQLNYDSTGMYFVARTRNPETGEYSGNSEGVVITWNG